ncbi:acylphosphatase isozyme Ch1 [Lentinus tigrinus ALCF2SS1-7]|uniref:acylphosphatase isozyme Ch1 n=1 Tax=Lentinus tigrinus ALCF2SS1-7 TaxID=1328758 RepID=UPI001165DDC5|nr:acylphosphatase isozyme Ch1 [Lentinus tigrinus ALCF2SS1-7]
MTFHTVDYRVKGKVQGVFFRAFTKDRAQQHGLVGWVKNEPSGDVVGTAQGRREALEKFLLIPPCGKEELQKGPPHAKVTGVEFTNEALLDRPQFHQFEKVRNPRRT